MNSAPDISAEDPWVIAIHEAGHLAAGFLLGREIEKVTITIQEDGKRGCYYYPIDDSKWNDFDHVMTLLAGPRAQVEMIPESLSEGKARLFEERIILPMPSPGEMPCGVYDSTGWEFDIKYIYRLLCFPGAPARGMSFQIKHQTIIDRAEQRVRDLFKDTGVQESLRYIAKEIREAELIEGQEVIEVINRSKLIGRTNGKGFLSWQ